MKNQLAVNWDDFLKHYWQKKPVVLRQAFPNFIDPITPDELAGLAMESEIESRIVSNKDEKWDAKYGPFEDYSELGETNWSLLVQAVDHWHEEAATLVEPFRVFPHWQFEDLMISYATPQGGVGPHIDNYDVFITQGMGKRRWQVGDRNPHYRQFSAHSALLHVEDYAPIIDEELNPGDILYIPIGYPHNGVSLTESLSYSVGFRTPTSQEMLSGFADYVLDNVPKGIFYQDPTLQLSDKPYQIQPYEIEILRSQMCALINNNDLFLDWFGKQTSQPMHELNIIPLDPPYSYEELVQEIESGASLCRVPSIRIFKLGDHGYVHGEKIALSAQFIDLLCQKSQLTRDDLQDGELLQAMLSLVNKGFWYFDQ
ncbi:50S ribosomal protein L16 3-hydroxylase [Orbus hercynius]|uniref:50S ribosomal protein L16 3-hydroxylase n=1 Tax=Orbus hercynius TaxID=593135 RepID=A0A495RKD4_9GAMM|nr:cupin domain-containing protein [Orbus hercynius]RKS87791.1 50S ribosomal protein L16 3-hydroxylase [Orbus hercynius]